MFVRGVKATFFLLKCLKVSQNLALEAGAKAHVENTRKSVVIASGRGVSRHLHLRRKREAENVHLVVVHDHREGREDTQEAEVVPQASIDSVDP